MESRLNLSFSCAGDGPKRKSKKTLTLDSVIAWIKSKNYPEPVQDKLIEKANSYPTSALDHFRQNIHQHVQNAAKSSK